MGFYRLYNRILKPFFIIDTENDNLDTEYSLIKMHIQYFIPSVKQKERVLRTKRSSSMTFKG